jgi:hypothetical protein
LQPLKIDVGRFKREFSRLSKMTTFQRAMDKAIDAKADAWLSYMPLSKDQLFDTIDHRDYMTIVIPFGGQLHHARSTYKGASWYGQKTLLARPTHTLAILHAMGALVLETDFVVVRQEPSRQLRFCVSCKKHHEVADFVSSKRYLNGLSFACKKALDEGRRGTWRHAA